MNESATWEQITRLIDTYVGMVRNELRERWRHWPQDLTKKEMHEAIGALLARQVSLSTHLALSPPIWNGHIAPLVLRSMTDAYITLAWIFKDPANQAKHNLAVLKTVQKQNAALQRLLIKLGWPPPWHLPAVLLDRIVEAHESGNWKWLALMFHQAERG